MGQSFARQSRFSAGRECRLSPVRRPSRCRPPRTQSGARAGLRKTRPQAPPDDAFRQSRGRATFSLVVCRHRPRTRNSVTRPCCYDAFPNRRRIPSLVLSEPNPPNGPDTRRRTGFRTSVRPTNSRLFLPTKGTPRSPRLIRGNAIKVAGQGQSHTYETKKRFSPRRQFHLQAPKLRSSEPRDRLLR